MRNREVASRYAKALYAVAEEESKLDQIIEEISALAEVLTDKELKSHLNSPIIKVEEKKTIVDRLLESASFDGTTKNFIRLLADKSRLAVIDEISDLLKKYSDEKSGVVRGEVRYAGELSESDRTALESKVSKLLDKKLVLEYKQDPTVLGGVVVKVGDYTIDFSVNRQLERIKESLNAGVQ